MASFDNREIAEVERSKTPFATALTKTGTRLQIDELSKMELCKACAIVFPGARVWPHYTMDEMVGMLRTGELVPVKQPSIKNPNLPATDKQVQLVKALRRKVGENPYQDLPRTMGEADKEIKRLKGKVEDHKPEPEPETPKVDVPDRIEARSDVDLSAIEARLDGHDASIATVEAKVTAVTQLMQDLRPTIVQVNIASKGTVEITDRQHKEFPLLVQYLGAHLNVYLAGPPGTGKSTMACNAAKALGVDFYKVACNPSMMGSAVFGYEDAGGTYHPTPVRRPWEFGGLILFDEIDKCHPGVLSGVNDMVASGVGSFPDRMVTKHPDCYVVAAANTHGTGAVRGHESAQTIDKATLDRFWMLTVGYDEKFELELALAQYDDDATVRWVTFVQQCRANAGTEGILEYFTPRASIEGATALRVGINVDTIIRDRMRKHIDDITWEKLTRGTSHAR